MAVDPDSGGKSTRSFTQVKATMNKCSVTSECHAKSYLSTNTQVLATNCTVLKVKILTM